MQLHGFGNPLLGTVTNTPSLPSITSPQTLRFLPFHPTASLPQKPKSNQIGKKVIAKRVLHEKIHKLPGYPRPSTHSQDTTFTPSPSPPTSPPRTAPTARTKTTPRFPAPAKPTPPPKAAPTKLTSSKPSSSKGKRPTVEVSIPETAKPKPRSVPVRSQRGNPHLPLKSVRELDIDPFAHKSYFMTSHSNYNPHRFKSTMNHDFMTELLSIVLCAPLFLWIYLA
ncbi:extensin-like [Arachis stenosperma]|uniref:extensin-like n=1 Tax=Arachis stenosperma TaxID=217475 RepID=UPI0025ABA124|nr:extensin-like [Arachis stenosperma]